MRRAIPVLAAALLMAGCPGGSPALPEDDGARADLPGPDAGDPSPEAPADLPGPDPRPPDPGAFPADPPAGFLDPGEGPALAGAFRGRLNPYEALETPDVAWAKGRFTVHGPAAPEELAEGATVFRYAYPDTPEVPPDRRGKRFVVLQSYATSAGATFARARYALAQVLLPAEGLEALAGQAGPLADVAGVRGWVRDLDSVRRPDQALVQRDCWRGVHDPATPARAWVDGRANDAFAVGENVLAWVNLPLVTDPAALADLAPAGAEAVDGARCTCTLQGAPLPCAEFEAEAGRTGIPLSCGVPEDLGPSAGPSRTVFRFKGPLLPPAAEAPLSGVFLYDVAVDGVALPIDYAVHATRTTLSSGVYAGKGIVTLGAIGGIAEIAPGRFTYHYVDTQVLVDALQALKADGALSTPLDGRHVFSANVYAVEQSYLTATSSRVKVCPRAVLDVVGGAGTLWACTAANTAFEAGETLEMAGNLRLTSDPDALAGLFGDPTACLCSRDGVEESCDAFPGAGGAP